MQFRIKNEHSIITSLILALLIVGGTYYLSNRTLFSGFLGYVIYYLSFAFHFVPFALGYAQLSIVYTYLYYIVIVAVLTFIINYFIRRP